MQCLPEGVRVEEGRGALDRLMIAADQGEAEIHFHGAQITHFQPKGERPVLWMSSRSRFEGGVPGKPIRGGVPICFPWFGPKVGTPNAPAHGVARILEWQMGAVTREVEGSVRVTFELASNGYTRTLFPHDFAAAFSVTVGRTLKMDLTVHNPGPFAMTFEAALHSYFAVADVRQVAITGLEGVPFIDQADRDARKSGEAAPISIEGQVDRAYLGTSATVTILDPLWQRGIVIHKSGSATTVVWNPWIDKAKAMPDFGDDEWPKMICVETANAFENAVTLGAGASHVMSATIAVQPMRVLRGRDGG
jgi:glucose-6-phosphate 1-epimerase